MLCAKKTPGIDTGTKIVRDGNKCLRATRRDRVSRAAAHRHGPSSGDRAFSWSELRTYIVNNRHLIPNYGERYRNGEPIATGFVESTVNEVVSKRFCKR